MPVNRPQGSNTPVIPVLAQWMSGIRVSIARSRACSSSSGMALLWPNQPRLVITTRQSAPFQYSRSDIGANSTSKQNQGSQGPPGHIERLLLRPRLDAPDGGDYLAHERDVLAERHILAKGRQVALVIVIAHRTLRQDEVTRLSGPPVTGFVRCAPVYKAAPVSRVNAASSSITPGSSIAHITSASGHTTSQPAHDWPTSATFRRRCEPFRRCTQGPTSFRGEISLDQANLERFGVVIGLVNIPHPPR